MAHLSELRKLPQLPLIMVGGVFVMLLMWAALLPMSSRYPDLVLNKAYYADDAGVETLASVASKPFTPFKGPLFRGNNQQPLWLRIQLAPSVQPDWVAMFQPNFTQHVVVWSPQADGSWRRQETGNGLAFNQRPLQTLAQAVVVQPHPTQITTLYARVETPTAPIAVRVISRENSDRFNTLLYLVGGLFSGIGVIMILLSLLLYVTTRDSLWGVDAAFNVAGLLMLGTQLNILPSLLWPNTPALSSQLVLHLNLLAMVLTNAVHFSLIRLFERPRWSFLPFMMSLMAYPIIVVLILTGHGDLAMSINNKMILCTVLVGFVIAVFVRHEDPFLHITFRIAYIGMLVYFVAWAIPLVLQVQTGNLSTLYPSLPASLFTMLMLLLILSRNTQLKLVANLKLQQEKREAELALQAAYKHHEDVSSFFGMLMHEVRNPLSAIRMGLHNVQREFSSANAVQQRRMARVQEAVTEIDDVLERGLEIDQLVQGALTVSLAPVAVADWLQQQCDQHAATSRLQLTNAVAFIATADSHLLSLMLRNLLDNAAKYSPPNSTVAVTLSNTVSTWRLCVQNTVGTAGFPDADKIFGKYYRASGAMRQSGMGLGLFWVRGVARQLGGDVYYEAQQQQVVFTLCLPR